MGLLTELVMSALAVAGEGAAATGDPVKVAGSRWAECAIAAASRFVDLDETAESVATAALGACKREEMSVKAAVIAAHGHVDTQEMMPGIIADHRQSLITFVMDTRVQRRSTATTKK